MNQDKLNGLIGLCRRAGQLSLGTDTVLRTLKSGRCAAVLMDEAAAPNTVKRLDEAARAANVPLLRELERVVLLLDERTALLLKRLHHHIQVFADLGGLLQDLACIRVQFLCDIG